MPIISDINQTIENLDLLKFVESKGEKPEKKTPRNHNSQQRYQFDLHLLI